MVTVYEEEFQIRNGCAKSLLLLLVLVLLVARSETPMYCTKLKINFFWLPSTTQVNHTGVRFQDWCECRYIMSEQKQLNVADNDDGGGDEVSFFLLHAKWLALSEDDDDDDDTAKHYTLNYGLLLVGGYFARVYSTLEFRKVNLYEC